MARTSSQRKADVQATCEIISIGNELITGTIVDTNASWLSKQIAHRGLAVRHHVTVGDWPADIARAIRTALGRAGVVLVTGGIGPTRDDFTREAAARALGRKLVQDRAGLQRLRAYFGRRGWPLLPSQRRQTCRPQGARTLLNPIGTAEGFWLTHRRARPAVTAMLFVLPGVPTEMEHMYRTAVAPLLRQRAVASACLARKILRLFGASEVHAEAKIEDLMNDATGARVGTRVTPAAMEVSIQAADADPAAARALLRRVERQLRKRLGDLVFGTGSDTLEAVIVQRLRKNKKTVALAESCTGGGVSDLLTHVPGASDCLLESVVAYANTAKTRTLGVPAALIRKHGAVSAPVAARMACGIKAHAGADFGIGITGIAGPGGGSKKKPVGLVYIAVADADGVRVKRYVFGGSRTTIKRRAANTALNLLRLALT